MVKSKVIIRPCPYCKQKVEQDYSWRPEIGLDQRFYKFICSECHYEWYQICKTIE